MKTTIKVMNEHRSYRKLLYCCFVSHWLEYCRCGISACFDMHIVPSSCRPVTILTGTTNILFHTSYWAKKMLLRLLLLVLIESFRDAHRTMHSVVKSKWYILRTLVINILLINSLLCTGISFRFLSIDCVDSGLLSCVCCVPMLCCCALSNSITTAFIRDG